MLYFSCCLFNGFSLMAYLLPHLDIFIGSVFLLGNQSFLFLPRFPTTKKLGLFRRFVSQGVLIGYGRGMERTNAIYLHL